MDNFVKSNRNSCNSNIIINDIKKINNISSSCSSGNDNTHLISNAGTLSPGRKTRIRSYSFDERQAKLETSTQTHSFEGNDLNPLKPCGACNEWLKKIAEVNPNFKVLTFTDPDITGVF